MKAKEISIRILNLYHITKSLGVATEQGAALIEAHAIEFAMWIVKENYIYNKSFNFWIDFSTKQQFATMELYNKFKEEQK